MGTGHVPSPDAFSIKLTSCTKLRTSVMRNVLVTGGAGFIGSHIVATLVERGDNVRVLDNLSTGNIDNLPDASAGVTFLEGDLTDRGAVDEAVADIDVIFHEAALASVPLSVERPLDTHAHCVTGTVNLLDAARTAGVRRLVYAGSSSAYGDQPNSAKRETDLPVPISPYGAAKLAAELYVRAFASTYDLETVVVRYFNVFGPRQDPNSAYSAVIPLFVMAMLSGQRPTVYGDGLQSRDFTYVQNVVHGNLLAADAAGVSGKVFNVANGRTTSLLDLLATLNRLLDTDIQPIHEPARIGDVRDSMADITQARTLLGYEPPVGFIEGLERSIEYYRATALSGA
jgi:UDP-glucose 4-epimerase